MLGERRVRAVTVDGTDEDFLGVPASAPRGLPALPPFLLRLRRALTPAPGSAGRDPVTQYVVFDGADSGYYPPVTNVPAIMASWFKNDGYVQVFEQGDVYVYRRG